MDWDAPAMAPPNGVIPNLKDPESWAYESIVTTAVCVSLMMPFFLLRLYSRIFVTRSLGWDDYTCVVGVMCAITYAGVFTNMINYGFGVHQWNVRLRDVAGGLRFLLVYTLFYGPTMFFIKASVLLLYRRVFSPDRQTKILIYSGIAYLLITNGVSTILFGALCAPRNGESYLIRYMSAQCVNNVTNLGIANGVVNVIADIYLLVLPLPIIWKLHLSSRKKYSLIGVFLTGFLACLASCASVALRSLYGHHPDYTFWSPRMVITSLIEAFVGIICASMPACAAVFRQPCPGYGRLPSFDSLRTWFSKLSVRLVTTISSQSGRRSQGSSDIPVSEKAESVILRMSQESAVGSVNGLVGLNAPSSLSRNTP